LPASELTQASAASGASRADDDVALHAAVKEESH
jgi:hypothetical protein